MSFENNLVRSNSDLISSLEERDDMNSIKLEDPK